MTPAPCGAIFPLDTSSSVIFRRDPAAVTLLALGELHSFVGHTLSSLEELVDDGNHYPYLDGGVPFTRTGLALLECEINALVMQCNQEILSCFFLGECNIIKRTDKCRADIRALVSRLVASI